MPEPNGVSRLQPLNKIESALPTKELNLTLKAQQANGIRKQGMRLRHLFDLLFRPIILTFLFMFGSVGDAGAQFLYTVVENTITITGYEGPGGAVTVPSTIEDLPVVAIGVSAFSGQNNIESITLSENVEVIEAFAFYRCHNLATAELNPGLIQIAANAFRDCDSLKLVDLPDTVRTIGTDAFQNCTSMTAVNGGSGLETIGERAFYLCSNLKSIALGPQLVTLGKTAFGYCTNLESVTLPVSLEIVGQRAFQYCHSLTSIDIPAGVTTVGTQQFSNCNRLLSINVDPGNLNYSDIDGVLFNKNQTNLIAYPGGREGIYQIPAGVQRVGDTAFDDSIHLSGVAFGDDVAAIGFAAFGGCDSLNAVEIPAGVTFIDERAFTDCKSLKSINVATENPVYFSGDGVLFSKDQTTLLQFPGGRSGLYVVPDTTTNIGTFSFALSPFLTDVVVHENVQTLENLAFYFCNSLRGIYFGGEPPVLNGSSVFFSSPLATGYYRSSALGWGEEFGGIPTAIWNPTLIRDDASFGIKDGRMQFTILWSEDAFVGIYSRPSLIDTPWVKIADISIVNYTGLFVDPFPASEAAYFYQVEVK